MKAPLCVCDRQSRSFLLYVYNCVETDCIKKSTDKRQEKGTISKKHLWSLIMCFNDSIVYPQKKEDKIARTNHNNK